jgi:hypothetical protein
MFLICKGFHIRTFLYVIFRHISGMVFLNLEYECKMIKFRYTISVSVCWYVKTRNASLFYSSLIIRKQQLYPSSDAPCSVTVRLCLTGAQLAWLRCILFILRPSRRKPEYGIQVQHISSSPFCPFRNTNSFNSIECYVIFAIYTRSSK